MAQRQARRPVQTLERALRALELIADAPGGITVSELGRRLEVDKSSAHRMLATLESFDHVRFDPASRRYTLGMRLVGLGAAALRGADIAEISRPVLQRLAEETGEAAHLAVLSQGQVLFLAKANAPAGTLTVNTGIGSRAPAHCTSLGKVLLAMLEDDEAVDRIVVQQGLPRYTARTITEAEALKLHLRQVRGQGYAIDDEERDVGLRCVAAPVMEASGRTVAALGISGPAARMPLDRLDALAAHVRRAAGEVSQALGYVQSATRAAPQREGPAALPGEGARR
ncbi:MAG TPA: IclR family transcriptional regulator [Chloroflexota bacterium]|nr:IclR family transcriptional regulator [Chloroflexota bacterium]